MNDGWFVTGVGSHFLDCLQFSERQVSLIKSNSREWPWTVLGLAALLQASCVLYLDERDTMEVATLAKKCGAETVAALQKDSGLKVPVPYLAPPKELLKRVLSDSKKITLSTYSRDDLKKLFDMRNEFAHFKQTKWCLQTTGLPRISREVFQFVDCILKEPGLYIRLSHDERIAAQKLCEASIKHCETLGIVQ